MVNRIAYFYPDTAKTEPNEDRALARQLNDEYQYGYTCGWIEAEDSRKDRKAIANTLMLALGMLVGLVLSKFL